LRHILAKVDIAVKRLFYLAELPFQYWKARLSLDCAVRDRPLQNTECTAPFLLSTESSHINSAWDQPAEL
jgi:hypothetical protein